MKIPLDWLQKYIKLEHTPEEFGKIMTDLEFMQDGPIKDINEMKVIDLEIRQNRPDMLSVIGAAREYAAYVNKKVDYPEQVDNFEIEWAAPQNLISVEAPKAVKRFVAVKINKVKVKKSPDYIKNALEAYGIASINNIVDITNYVMLEYGIPMHAFDLSKLIDKKSSKSNPLITLRMAKDGEKLMTWQGTEAKLTENDLILSDPKNRIIGIGGITGESKSGVTNTTKNIILEAANYDHAITRRSSLRHNIITESSLRHSKILPSDMVEVAIKRAIFLIQELAGGEIAEIEDYYKDKQQPIVIDFNTVEINRLGGVHLEDNAVIDLLNRLKFDVIGQKEALGVDKNIMVVRVPKHRTDITLDVDLVEEVLRLWGYDNIPTQPITSTPPVFSTPLSVQLEEKISDILVSLGLDEHITNPLIEFSNKPNEIKLENPLSQEKNALRTTIRETLMPVISNYKKAGKEKIGIFEVGKIYKENKKADYTESKRIETLYSGYKFEDKIKPDFLAVMKRLGFRESTLEWSLKNNALEYSDNGKHIATLRSNGYELLTENIVPLVNIALIPYEQIQTSLVQRITQDISILVNKNQLLGEIANKMKSADENIRSVELDKVYDDIKLGKNKISATFKVILEDPKYTLTKEKLAEIRKRLLKGVIPN